MIESLVYASPDLIVLLSILVLSCFRLLKEQKTSIYFNITKVCIILLMLLRLIFYNKTFADSLLMETSYTTMLKMVICLVSLAWYYVSLKWFDDKHYSGYAYCVCGLICIESLCLIISSINLISLIFAVTIFFILHNFMCKLYANCDDNNAHKKWFDFVLFIIAIIGCGIIYNYCESLLYFDINEYLAQNRPDFLFYGAIMMVVLPLLYILGIFPMYFFNIDINNKSILPVIGFIGIVPPIAIFSALTILFHNMIFYIYDVFVPALIICSLLSMYYGTFMIRKEKQLYNILFYSSMYHFGIVLLLISYMQAYAILSALVYFIIYLVALLGIYISLYAFKSRGEYLQNIDDISGSYQVLPYIALSVTILILSVLGTPPMLGFLGKFYIVNQFFIAKDYILVLLVLLPSGVLISAYLRIIKSIYFKYRTKNFDRVNKEIYLTLFVIILLVLIMLFNTYEIVNTAKNIIYKMF